MSDCPPRLRGDLTKWLLEINTGVYVGNMNARVRDRLWERVCENLRNGRATMVFRSSGEQHLDFRVHNTTWEPVDYDGIKLIRRPVFGQSADTRAKTPPAHLYKAEIRQIARKKARQQSAPLPSDYCVLDLETTGLDCEKDEIIEIGALRVRDGNIAGEFQVLVFTDKRIPEAVECMTGISSEEVSQSGIPLREAVEQLIAFAGTDILVCHNAAFDQQFLITALRNCGLPTWKTRFQDTLILARKRLKGLDNYQLSTVAEHLGIEVSEQHRAIPDCYLAQGIYTKLREI
ncbi:MAG: type I-E CRISPR-associated endoribonuclease Cas2 [Oscillibacter sp.]|nr:type I-E CRISPR-associated endoribonuclease Cas2 [Oscillibacter sp.]